MEAQRSKVRTFLAELLQARQDGRAFGDADVLFSSGRLDSLAAVQTVLFLEKEFGVDFARVGFDQTLIDSVNAITALLS